MWDSAWESMLQWPFLVNFNKNPNDGETVVLKKIDIYTVVIKGIGQSSELSGAFYMS